MRQDWWKIWEPNSFGLQSAFELVDVSSMLPGLERRPGLTTWRPSVDKQSMKTYGSYQEYQSSDLDANLKMKLTPGHFPPDDAESLNLPFWYVKEI